MIPLETLRSPRARLSAAELGPLLGVRPRQVGNLVKSGYLPPPEVHRGDPSLARPSFAHDIWGAKRWTGARWRVADVNRCYLW